MVSCRYFIRGETACKKVTSTGSGEHELPWLQHRYRGRRSQEPTSSLLMESGDRLMCWMYLRSSGSICKNKEKKKKRYLVGWKRKEASRPTQPESRPPPSRSAA